MTILKIMTCRNSEVIIDKITNIEIHHGEYKVENYAQLYDAITYGPGPFAANGRTPETVESYDFELGNLSQPANESKLSCNVVKYIDYERNEQWRRVAIQQFAYVVDETTGKTVSKVGV